MKIRNLVVALAVVLAACGGDDDSGDASTESEAKVMAAWTLMSATEQAHTCELVAEFGARQFASGLDVADVAAAADVLDSLCG